MKKIRITSLFCLTFAIFSSLAIANEKKWELWTGGLGNVAFNFSSQTSTSFQMFSIFSNPSASIGYMFNPGIQVIFTPGFSLAHDADTKITAFDFKPLLGINFSFSQELEDSPYVQLQAGVALVSKTNTIQENSTQSESHFQWAIQLGKRFKLAEGITYAPAIHYSMVFSDKKPTNVLSFVPVQFSFLF